MVEFLGKKQWARPPSREAVPIVLGGVAAAAAPIDYRAGLAWVAIVHSSARGV
ncbi:hypothetical protein STHU_43150 [Allostella humosa]|nr:hypothetical protein STHU_43150 [Stella humosa]